MKNVCDFTNLVCRMITRLDRGMEVAEIIEDLKSEGNSEELRFALQGAILIKNLPGPEDKQWHEDCKRYRCHIDTVDANGMPFTVPFENTIHGVIDL